MSEAQQTERQNIEEQLRIANIEISMLRLEIKSLRQVLQEDEDTIDEIHRSTSWRITLPMRKVKNGILKLGQVAKLLKKAPVFFSHLRNYGFAATMKNVKRRLGAEQRIILKNLVETDEQTLAEQRAHVFATKPLISVIVPLYNTVLVHLAEMLDSVQAQTYGNWQLVLIDASDNDGGEVGTICQQRADSDARIIYRRLENNEGISQNTNAGLELATGDYLTLLDHDDILHPTALFEVVKAIDATGADFIYSDELNFFGNVENGYVPHFKPDFSPDTLRSYNYITHLMVYSRALREQVGDMRSECSGSQDFDLALRLSEKADKVAHIPKLLYFWRQHGDSYSTDAKQKISCMTAARRALSDHLYRKGLDGVIDDAEAFTNYHIRYAIQGKPLVSIVIPNKDHIEDLDKCLRSIAEKTTYDNYEIVIAENNSIEDKTFGYYEKLSDGALGEVRVLRYEGSFNYSAINNFAAREAKGQYLLFLNNDTEVITPEWLEEMLMFAQRADVAAVGAKLYYPDDTIQHAGVILGIGGVAGHAHKCYKREESGYANRLQVAQNISAVTGACLMVATDKFWQVGGLSEELAVAFNDVDLCLKFREQGWLNIFTPFAELYHYESKSRGYEDSPEKVVRFKNETIKFHLRWGEVLEQGDPYYNPNLTLTREDFSLA